MSLTANSEGGDGNARLISESDTAFDSASYDALSVPISGQVQSCQLPSLGFSIPAGVTAWSRLREPILLIKPGQSNWTVGIYASRLAKRRRRLCFATQM